MPATIRATNIAPKELTDAVAEWIDSSCDQYLILDNQDYSIKAYQIEDCEALTGFANASDDDDYECEIEAKSENTEHNVIIKTDSDTTKLEHHVIAWLNTEAENYGGDVKAVALDLMKGGCENGYVSHLTYYTQTTAFYDEYEDEIDVIIQDLHDNNMIDDVWIVEKGFTMPLIKNRLAWTAFEEVVRYLMEECGVDI